MRRTKSLRSLWTIPKLLALSAGVAALATALLANMSLGAGQVGLSVDCDGNSPQLETECQVGGEQPFTVAIVTSDAPAAGFVAYQAKLRWDDAVLDYRPSAEVADEVVWPDCAFPVRTDNRPSDASVLLGCLAIPPLPSDYGGSLLLLEFVCIGNGNGQLTLVAGAGDDLTGSFFIELPIGGEQVIVNPKLTGAVVACTGPAVDTATPEPTAQTPQSPAASPSATLAATAVATASPTSTPTATPIVSATETITPTVTASDSPTRTLTPTVTITPLGTPFPTVTRTPTPSLLAGDASCDGVINPVDAALILQLAAGLISELPCPSQGDANGDGVANPVDAALILQFSAGLISSLPP